MSSRLALPDAWWAGWRVAPCVELVRGERLRFETASGDGEAPVLVFSLSLTGDGFASVEEERWRRLNPARREALVQEHLAFVRDQAAGLARPARLVAALSRGVRPTGAILTALSAYLAHPFDWTTLAPLAVAIWPRLITFPARKAAAFGVRRFILG